MTACFMTLTDVNPKGWWMFEKYDGIRAFWNPNKRSFFSRFGRAFDIPQEIIDSMPTNIFFDGEIWFERNKFEESLKISQRTDFGEIDWKQFKFVTFDVPNHPGTYEERYSLIMQSIHDDHHRYV